MSLMQQAGVETNIMKLSGDNLGQRFYKTSRRHLARRGTEERGENGQRRRASESLEMDARPRRTPSSPPPAVAVAALSLLLLFPIFSGSYVSGYGDDSGADGMTALQKHATFFDGDKDGVVTFSERYEGPRIWICCAHLECYLHQWHPWPSDQTGNLSTEKSCVFVCLSFLLCWSLTFLASLRLQPNLAFVRRQTQDYSVLVCLGSYLVSQKIVVWKT